MGEYTLLSIQVYGLAIVISMLVAVVIRVVVGILSGLKKKTHAVAVSAYAAPVDEYAGDHVAAIAAAVWAVAGPHRIVHIEPSAHGRVWTSEGRFTHHASHAVEHRSVNWNQKKNKEITHAKLSGK